MGKPIMLLSHAPSPLVGLCCRPRVARISAEVNKKRSGERSLGVVCPSTVDVSRPILPTVWDRKATMSAKPGLATQHRPKLALRQNSAYCPNPSCLSPTHYSISRTFVLGSKTCSPFVVDHCCVRIAIRVTRVGVEFEFYWTTGSLASKHRDNTSPNENGASFVAVGSGRT
jgi:hypothetical protein